MARTLLVIDDLSFYRRRLRNLMRQMGYVVYEADSGEAGCRTAERVQPDAVLLDQVMPGWSGCETYARLRATGYQGTVIVLSPRPDGTEARRLLREGVHALLPKGVSPAAIDAELRDSGEAASAA
jgi:DNA-binding NarL/FixJ family response regulator